jgi:hypothetical protein
MNKNRDFQGEIMRINTARIDGSIGTMIAFFAVIAFLTSACSLGNDDGTGSATPVFQSESFDGIMFVSLSCAVAGATIRYTTDGCDPTDSSKAYSNSFPLFTTTTVKAVASGAAFGNSPIATKLYTIDNYTHKVVNNTPYFVKNGESNALPVPPSTVSCSTNCCGVSAIGDVYVAGSTKDVTGNSLPCYWVNGAYYALPLPVGAVRGGLAFSFVFKDSDFYLSGYTTDAASVSTPCYWKNGAYVALSGYSSSLGGTISDNLGMGDDGTLFVSGSVYLTANVDTPCYWTDGTYHQLSLPDSMEGKCEQVLIEGSKTYVSGVYDSTGADYHNVKPCLWVDGVLSTLDAPTLTLPSGATSCGYRTNSIFVSGTDIYVGGYSYIVSSGSWIMSPLYWKNGVITTLSLPPYSGVSGGVWSFKAMSGTVLPFGSWSSDSGYGNCYWSDGVCLYGMNTK